jgi:hypothetical protein
MSHLDYTKQQLKELTMNVHELAVAAGKHDLALSALLSAYATLAMAHPCCLQECADVTFRLSMMLAKQASIANVSGQVH